MHGPQRAGAFGQAGRLARLPEVAGPIPLITPHSRPLETANKQFSRSGEMHPYVSCTGHQHLGKREQAQRLQRLLTSSFDRKKENSVMIKFGLIGAAAALLMVATPAMAKQRVDHTRYGYAQRLPRSVYNAYGFDRSSDVTPGNTSADFDRRNTFN